MDGVLDRIPLPDHLVSFEELQEDYPDLTIPILEELAKSVGVQVQGIRINVPTRRSKRFVRALSMDDVEKIEDVYSWFLEDAFNQDTIFSNWKLARALKSSVETLMQVAQENSIEPVEFDSPNHLVGLGFDKSQRILLRDFIAEKRGKVADESIHPYDSVRIELKIGRPKLQTYCDALGLKLDEYLFGMTNGFGFTEEQYEQVVQHHQDQEIKQAPPGVVSVTRAAKQRKMTPETLFEFIEGSEVQTKTYLVRGVPQECLTEEDIRELEAAYDPEVMKLFMPISIRQYARENRAKPHEIMELAQEAGVELKEYYFGSRKNFGITPDEIKRIQEFFVDFPPVPFSDENTFSFKEAARVLHIDSRTLKKRIAEAEIDVKIYKFPNGKAVGGLVIEQLEAIRQENETLGLVR